MKSCHQLSWILCQFFSTNKFSSVHHVFLSQKRKKNLCRTDLIHTTCINMIILKCNIIAQRNKRCQLTHSIDFLLEKSFQLMCYCKYCRVTSILFFSQILIIVISVSSRPETLCCLLVTRMSTLPRRNRDLSSHVVKICDLLLSLFSCFKRC